MHRNQLIQNFNHAVLSTKANIIVPIADQICESGLPIPAIDILQFLITWPEKYQFMVVDLFRKLYQHYGLRANKLNFGKDEIFKRTLLHWAVIFQRHDIISFLLSTGISALKSKDKLGNTPVFYNAPFNKKLKIPYAEKTKIFNMIETAKRELIMLKTTKQSYTTGMIKFTPGLRSITADSGRSNKV